MSRVIKGNQSFVIRALKFLGKLGLFVLDVVLAVASDKPRRKSYSDLTAEHLYDEGLVRNQLYSKSRQSPKP